MAENLSGALREAYALAQGTRCRQFLFSLSLNPPPNEIVPVRDFEKAIDAIERKLGLEGQPRAVVFHEKDGRRHAHCVWSRIEPQAMKAIDLPHYKLKLRDMSRELYLEHGWRMPRGLMDSRERDPRNFTREQWQALDPTSIVGVSHNDIYFLFWESGSNRGCYAIDMKQNGVVTSICSGSLIAPKVVLTAGHCVHGFTGWNITCLLYTSPSPRD